MSTSHSPQIPAIERELSANDWLKCIDDALKSAAAGSAMLTAEQLLAKLRELAPESDIPATSIISERVIRGYKVRRSYTQTTEEERKTRQAVTVQAIAQALASMRPH